MTIPGLITFLVAAAVVLIPVAVLTRRRRELTRYERGGRRPGPTLLDGNMRAELGGMVNSPGVFEPRLPGGLPALDVDPGQK